MSPQPTSSPKPPTCKCCVLLKAPALRVLTARFLKNWVGTLEEGFSGGSFFRLIFFWAETAVICLSKIATPLWGLSIWAQLLMRWGYEEEGHQLPARRARSAASAGPFSTVACHLSTGNIKSALLFECQDKTKPSTRQLACCVSRLQQSPSEGTGWKSQSGRVPEQTRSLQTNASSLALIYSQRQSWRDTVSGCFTPFFVFQCLSCFSFRLYAGGECWYVQGGFVTVSFPVCCF